MVHTHDIGEIVEYKVKKTIYSSIQKGKLKMSNILLKCKPFHKIIL